MEPQQEFLFLMATYVNKRVHFLNITTYIYIEKYTYKSSLEFFLTNLDLRRNFILSIISFKHG